jgi:hypothetical protein
MQTTRSFFLGVAAAVLLAGCGSAASSSPSTGAPAATSSSAPSAASASQAAGAGATTPLTCDLAPSSLVSADLGVSGLAAPKQVINSGGASCIYAGSKGVITLNLLNGATTGKMSVEQQTLAKSEQTKAFAGLGDEAFSASLSVGEGIPSPNTLVARQGSVEIMLVSPASVTAEKSLEEHIFTKVG